MRSVQLAKKAFKLPGLNSKQIKAKQYQTLFSPRCLFPMRISLFHFNIFNLNVAYA